MFAFMLYFCVQPMVCEKVIHGDFNTIKACNAYRDTIIERHKDTPLLRITRCMEEDYE